MKLKIYQAIWLAGLAMMLTSFLPIYNLHPQVVVGLGMWADGCIHWYYSREQ